MSPTSDLIELEYNPESLLSAVFRSGHVVLSGGSIEIIYSVNESAEITIWIYNLKGQLVKKWSGSASPGMENSWTWYGKNMHDEDMHNGVYILKIEAVGASGESAHEFKLVSVLR